MGEATACGECGGSYRRALLVMMLMLLPGIPGWSSGQLLAVHWWLHGQCSLSPCPVPLTRSWSIVSRLDMGRQAAGPGKPSIHTLQCVGACWQLPRQATQDTSCAGVERSALASLTESTEQQEGHWTRDCLQLAGQSLLKRNQCKAREQTGVHLLVRCHVPAMAKVRAS